MYPIDGNVSPVIEKRIVGERDPLTGERVSVWVEDIAVDGFIDYMAGDSTIGDSNAKLADTTHIFVGDYVDLSGVSPETHRMVHGNKAYNILEIDDPMGLGFHLEIYLQYVGVRA